MAFPLNNSTDMRLDIWFGPSQKGYPSMLCWFSLLLAGENSMALLRPLLSLKSQSITSWMLRLKIFNVSINLGGFCLHLNSDALGSMQSPSVQNIEKSRWLTYSTSNLSCMLWITRYFGLFDHSASCVVFRTSYLPLKGFFFFKQSLASCYNWICYWNVTVLCSSKPTKSNTIASPKNANWFENNTCSTWDKAG